jgi:phosphatidylserine decarboxylase
MVISSNLFTYINMETITLLLLSTEIILFSTIWYLYLRKKTHIRPIFVLTDNLYVFILSLTVVLGFGWLFSFDNVLIWLLPPPLVLGFSFIITMIRFWRTPRRKVHAKEGEMVSPADGKVLYIKELEQGETPVSIKKGLKATLKEITNTDIIKSPGWIIGINMTPFDVHKNCIPIAGVVKIVKHIKGKFLSLKEPTALVENERVTVVVETGDKEQIGIVQTASKLVKRIDTYVKEGEKVEQGKWYGMIRFGSQVDLIIPAHYEVNVEIGQQLFAKTTIIAKK